MLGWKLTCPFSLVISSDVNHLEVAVWAYFFLFLFRLFLFLFLGPHAQHMEVPRIGVKSELQLPAYTTAHHARSLTHWARPGIKHASSWILVGFVNHWAMVGTPIQAYFFKLGHWHSEEQKLRLIKISCFGGMGNGI